MMAAIGIAMSAPAMPNSELKAKIASRVTNGLTPTVHFMMRGTSRVFSICWMMIEAMITKMNLLGEMDNATRPAGTAPRAGPTIGTASIKPATKARTKALGRPISR